uniref:SMP-30/Gluconolactonase/LRE-like region domain-containing protein n=1 Tax=Branchiostoma floridae TaxID=7739 RepID=C3YR83_BRAFL|eukprot:XP_002601068.1 hypothetical protein BRAFLDRAFT_75503 [Branchiostoma floridae]
MTSTNLNTEAAKLVFCQAENDEGLLTQSDASRHERDEDDDIDHEHILTESGAAAEIESIVVIKYGDADIVQTSYMCQGHMACGTADTEETETKTPYGDDDTCSISNNATSGQPIGYDGASANDADCVEDGQNTKNVRHHPNMLYPHVSCLQRDQVQNHIYTQNTLNSISINTENPNLIYTQKTLNSDPLNQQNVCNTNPMYAPNGIPELELPASDSNITATSTGPDTSADICDIKPYAVRYQTDDDVATKSKEARDPQNQDASCCDIDKIEPYAVRYKEDDDVPAEGKVTVQEQLQDASCGNVGIEPYAVRYGEDDDLPTDRNTTESEQTQDASPDNVNIEPYAVAYMDQDEVTSEDRNDTRTISAGCSSSGDATNVSVGQGSSNDVRDDRNQAPMPNGPQQHISDPCDGNEKSGRIIFGGLGTEPGKFKQIRGVAVSGDNEIFVADFSNRRIQVHTMGGVFLRLFPTVVPGKKVKTMQPSGVAIDGEGHLWVVGKRKDNVHVVQYSCDGQPLSKFVVTGEIVLPDTDIAVDASNHKVIVSIVRGLLVFQPNGSLHLRFGEKREFITSGVTTDSEGNILVTVRPSTIQMYNRHGRLLFTARVRGHGGRPGFPRGICMDTFGRIVVANVYPAGRVDMYTSRGDFVRTLANITHPWGVAVGRDGQLVVTSLKDDTVTIFPGQVI